MLQLKIIFLCICFATGAPPRDKIYEYSIVGNIGNGDAFRPKFPGMDIRKASSDGSEPLLFKMPYSLDSRSDSQAALITSGGTEVDAISTQENAENISPKININHASDGNADIQIPEKSDLTRDVIEKPLVEKTILQECDCEKQIEEKHLSEPSEKNSAENLPNDSQYQESTSPEKSNPEDSASKKDLYDVPVNPDFGLAPSKPEDNNSEINLYDVPINPDFGFTSSDDRKLGQEEPNSGKGDFLTFSANTGSNEYTSEEKRPEHKPAFPEETGIILTSEQSARGPGLPGGSEKPSEISGNPVTAKNPVDTEELVIGEPAKKSNENTKPILPDQDKDTKPNFDSQYPQTPVLEQEPDSYPQHPVDGPKVPIGVVPLGPKNATHLVEDKVFDISKSAEPTSLPPTDSHQLHTTTYVDIKPDLFEAIGPSQLGSENPPVQEKKPLSSLPSISTVCETMGLRKFIFFLNKAGYKDVLSRKRPLTIFVPSDEAWDLLPPFVLNRLQRDRYFLRRVLRSHMVDGLENGQVRRDYYCPSMEQGTGFFLNSYGKKMYVNDIPAMPSPVKPANGAVYVLSRVLYPLPANNLAEAIQTTGTFTRFYTLAAEAGILDKELSGRGPYTLFAPTDEAFNKLPLKTIEWLSWDKEAVRELLLKHLVFGTHYSTFVPENEESHLKSLNGEDIEFKQSDKKGAFSVNSAHLCVHDVTATNGVLHAVDEVLFSSELKPRPFFRPPLKSIYG